jgi:hypothetical protein
VSSATNSGPEPMGKRARGPVVGAGNPAGAFAGIEDQVALVAAQDIALVEAESDDGAPANRVTADPLRLPRG